jgi:hypothetical protein
MTVVAQLGIGARTKMQMAATGNRGFRACGDASAASPLTINPPGRH